MTRARYSQLDLTATSFYHVINQCIRRSYLCGDDSISGKTLITVGDGLLIDS